jgi:hypothetical protein
MKKTIWILALALLTLASMAFAADERNPNWGTRNSPSMVGVKVEPIPANLGKIQPATAVIPGKEDLGASSLVFHNSQVAVGGAGLRNRTRAHMQLTGGNVNHANATAGVMYWAIITTGPAPSQYYSVMLTNEQSGLSAILVGTVMGTGPSPGWPGDTITVFRVLVPTNPNGPLGPVNVGDYQVDVASGAANVYNDPWVGTPSAPEWEGVSLILVFPGDKNNDGTVAFYDTGISGVTFGGSFGDTLEYTLQLPNQHIPRNFYNIGADGQVGNSIAGAFAQIDAEQLFINNKQVSGFPRVPGKAPDTLDPDSDWNGTIAGPLPQLWDTTGHTLNLGGTGGFLDVVYTNAKDDLLTGVANVTFQLNH